MAYRPDPRLLRAIRSQAGGLGPLLLATALVESGGRLDAVGDQGMSYGPYQEHSQGRGHGIPVAGRRDPVASTRRALREFQVFRRRGFRGPELAYRAQRPADRDDYVRKIAAALPIAQQLLAGAPSSPASGPPGAPASPAPGGYRVDAPKVDGRTLLALLQQTSRQALQGRMPGPDFTRALAALARDASRAPTITQVGEAVADAQGGIPGGGNFDPRATYGFPTGGVDSGRVVFGGEGGNWAGSLPRALAVAKAVGMTPSSQKRSRRLTASGNVSDHYAGATSSYAVDMPAQGAGDARYRQVMQYLARLSGNPAIARLPAGRWNNLNIGGYRYQIGWRTPGHYDHIHVGVRPA